jgi:cytochrome b561
MAVATAQEVNAAVVRGGINSGRYTSTAIALHWLMAVMIVCAAGLGLYMVGLELSPQKLKLYAWHKWLGVTIFVIALVRAAWRLTHAPPRLPATVPGWQRYAAACNHALIYVLLFAIPVSGWLLSSASGVQVVLFKVLPLPDLLEKDKALAEQLALLHAALNYTLMALLAVHIAASLKHHFYDRDEVLRRMLPLFKAR